MLPNLNDRVPKPKEELLNSFEARRLKELVTYNSTHSKKKFQYRLCTILFLLQKTKQASA